MVEKEVSVERTITESKQITICEQCQNQVDKHGIEHRKLDLCSGCVEHISMNKDEIDDAVIREVDEWLETRDTVGRTMQNRMRTLLALMAIIPVSATGLALAFIFGIELLLIISSSALVLSGTIFMFEIAIVNRIIKK